MFKPVHGLHGTLALGLSTVHTSIQLDSDSMAHLRSRLPNGDHTYLLVRNANNYEVVKVTAVQNATASIVRAQDGTNATLFAAGAEVEFVLGESAIQDIIDEKLLGEVHLTGTGVAEVSKLGPNTYSINVPAVSITSESEDIIVEGDYPEFVISAPIKSDCCG